MKKVIVTGGCGFIGSHLTEKLINLGYKVIVIDNLSTGRLENISNFKNKLKFYKLDIKYQNRIEHLFKDIDIVFHCAALADIVPSIQKPKSQQSRTRRRGEDLSVALCYALVSETGQIGFWGLGGSGA